MPPHLLLSSSQRSSAGRRLLSSSICTAAGAISRSVNSSSSSSSSCCSSCGGGGGGSSAPWPRRWRPWPTPTFGSQRSCFSSSNGGGAGAEEASSSSSGSSSGGTNRAQELFYEQLGFKTIVRDRLQAAKDEIHKGLGPGGEGFVVLKGFLRDADATGEEEEERLCRNMRAEALALFKAGLFYASFAYRGEERVDKKNVHNLELEGYEWDYAPSLLMYTREMMLHVPPLLNGLLPADQPRISRQAYANKIAVSTGGGSHYLKHTDNNTPESDQRRATLVYYLNPGWDVQKNGGQLRLFTRGGRQVDVSPEGDTLVLFFADELEHEVLPNHDEREEHHRVTYTLWLVRE